MKILAVMDLDALEQSGELILKVKDAMLVVSDLGFQMLAAVKGDLAAVPGVVVRMEIAAADLAKAATAFHEATRRAAERLPRGN